MRNRKEGFTLIELLIVIAIIGILAAVLIPNLLDARRRAFDTGAQSCLKEIATAEEVYLVDNQAYSGAIDETTINACNNVTVTGALSGTEYSYEASHANSAAVFEVSPGAGVQAQ